MREIVVAASFIIGVAASVFLLLNEDIVPPETAGVHMARTVDPLLGLVYTESNRKVLYLRKIYDA